MTIPTAIIETLSSPDAATRNWTVREIARRLGEFPSDVERELNRLAASGEVLAVDGGWELVPRAKQVAIKQGSLFG